MCLLYYVSTPDIFKTAQIQLRKLPTLFLEVRVGQECDGVWAKQLHGQDLLRQAQFRCQKKIVDFHWTKHQENQV